MSLEVSLRYIKEAVDIAQKADEPRGFIESAEHPGLKGAWTDYQFQWINYLDPISKTWIPAEKEMVLKYGKINKSEGR